MNSNLKFFKKSKFLPLDNFFKNVLYDIKFGYYSTKQPFGKDGDFVTSPKISKLLIETSISPVLISLFIVSSSLFKTFPSILITVSS